MVIKFPVFRSMTFTELVPVRVHVAGGPTEHLKGGASVAQTSLWSEMITPLGPDALVQKLAGTPLGTTSAQLPTKFARRYLVNVLFLVSKTSTAQTKRSMSSIPRT